MHAHLDINGEASDLFVEQRLSDLVEGESYLNAQVLAMREVFQAVMRGTLPARPERRDDFEFEVRVGREVKRIPLEPNGAVPAEFWELWEMAEASAKAGDPNCKVAHWLWSFSTPTANGFAGHVEVRRDLLPGKLRFAGRPEGTGKHDDARLKRAMQALDRGDLWNDVIGAVVADACAVPNGKEASPESARKRIVRKLRSFGYRKMISTR